MDTSAASGEERTLIAGVAGAKISNRVLLAAS
jgi:hypothetical protein